MKWITCGCATMLSLGACSGSSTPEKPAPDPAAAGAAPLPAPTAAARSLYATRVNGTVLHYHLLGAAGAPVVVLVHGTLANLGSWSAQDTAFARSYRVLSYSRRYHPPNAQQNDGQMYSPKLHAEDLAALLLQLQLAPAHIVGSSYGAYAALALAREHPSLVRSLVIAEPPVIGLLATSQEGDSVRRVFFSRALDPARRAFARGDSVAGVRAYWDGVTGVRGGFDRLPEPARANLLRHAFEMRLEMLAHREQYLPPITCAELRRVATPVLIVRGEQSPKLFQLISDELARCLRSDTTVTIPRAGHEMHLANPLYYNRVVLRFLATH